jgi:hypothetical protein
MKRSDADAAAFAAGVELAAVALYRLAVTKRELGEEAISVCNQFMRHHGDHAASFNQLLDQPVGGEGNRSVIATYRPMLDGADRERAVLDVVHGLEEMLAATHLNALAVVTDGRAAASTATIQGVECQHAVVLGTLLERPLEQLCPDFDQVRDAFDPGTFPA